MSVAFDIRPSPPLARDDVRRGLVALLRRRVPAQEVDDLAQIILCDALQAGSIPSDPEELRRWLVGIARHKIADYHRRAARVNSRLVGEAPLATCASSPVAFEERQVLERLLGAVETRRDAETMDWLVREHSGERLADIAAENGIGAPVVRQRVSRLRRALRSRWAGAVVLLLALGGLTAFGLSAESVAIAPERPILTRAPEAPASASPESVSFWREIEGEWVVQAVHPERELSASEQKLVDSYAKIGHVHVQDGHITIRANAFNGPRGPIPAVEESWAVTSVEQKAEEIGERARVQVRSPYGEADTIDLVFRRDGAGPRVDVRLRGHPRLVGSVTLRRPIH